MSNSDAPLIVTGREAHGEAAARALNGARRDVALLSFDLDARVYDRPEVAEACKDFLLISRHSRLRILLNDERPAARGHRLVELGRRLSSFCEFRVLGERQRELEQDWLIIDESQVLERRTPLTLEAQHFNDHPVHARARRRQFDSWWQQAEPASSLRALHFN